MTQITVSEKILYLMGVCIVISLLLNGFLIYTYYTAEKNFSSDLETLKYERISLSVPIDTTVTVPIKKDIDIEIPFDGKITVPFEGDITVPIKTEVKIEGTLEELGLGDLIDKIIEIIDR